MHFDELTYTSLFNVFIRPHSPPTKGAFVTVQLTYFTFCKQNSFKSTDMTWPQGYLDILLVN